ncbi:hypothetical protein C471_11666 [Halorubrum saccharovorum DSM 1137]|uniref:Uncharacterized protein n=1 Tax=Halorubrum saccharovorum DSM 1137 TaxID=1227484 RepID=M0DST2_9EURY|nr:hypothetical protein [Halorubrum saccharovorum]ELZ37757.1 hypothetical protein C471_11666 [Halorubrum saccharovorum DSM 1137]
MTSLSEAYGGRGRSEVDPRRLYLGVGSFVAGTLLLVAGLLVAAEVVLPSGYSSGEARRLGGVLGGVGVPLVFLGVMTVLPADRNTRVAAIVGAGVMGLGVALFAYAYPYHWVGGPRPELADLTLPTAGLYFVGAATTLWSVFVGVANFKTRNDPGGTVTMEVTHKGETKVIEVDRAELNRGGGVGLLGGTPDGDVETQTNRRGESASGSNSADSAGTGSGSNAAGSSPAGSRSTGGMEAPGTGTTGVSDGGATATDIRSPLDEEGENGSEGSSGPSGPVTPGASPAARDGPGDTYCGNCAQFDYVRTEQGMQPYCGHHDELMDDMDACEEWTPR